MEKTTYVVPAVLCTETVALLGYGMTSTTRNITPGSVVYAEHGPIKSHITATGVVISQNELEISSPVMAYVRAMNVTKGQRGNKGDLRVRIDSEEAQSRIEKVEEALKQAEFVSAQAARNVVRLRTLYERRRRILRHP